MRDEHEKSKVRPRWPRFRMPPLLSPVKPRGIARDRGLVEGFISFPSTINRGMNLCRAAAVEVGIGSLSIGRFGHGASLQYFMAF